MDEGIDGGESETAGQKPRGEPRVRSLLRATISFLNGSFQVETLVRDLSPTGARLAISADQALPEVFDLIIPKTGMSRRARVIWQRGGEIGVHFEGETPQAEPESDLGRLRARIRELETENRQLKIRIALLTEG